MEKMIEPSLSTEREDHAPAEEHVMSPEGFFTMDNDRLGLDIEKVVNSAYEELIGLSDDAVQRRSSANGWSIKEIIGHLVDSASNNHQRWVRLQIADGLDFPDYQSDNERWVRIQQYNDQAWESLLKLWRFFNLHLSTIVRCVDKECLQNIWVIDEDDTVTLNDLMVDYLRHLNVHLEQIRKNLSSMT
jgi:hypothetical protein